MSKAGETYNQADGQIKDGIKRYVYDIIASFIILVIIAASLHIFDIYDLNDPNELTDFLVDWVPYFIATVLLNADMYEKGSFIGKQVENYIKTVGDYSKQVSALTGEQLTAMGPFCIWYNEKALKEMREDILRKEGISFERYNDEFTENGETYKPLKMWSKKELDAKYGKNVRKAVFAAKNAKIVGINANTILSSFNVKDSTNLGKNEKEMRRVSNITALIRYLFFTGAMSMILIRNITMWNWVGIIEVIFKLSLCLARALMAYFKGYHDITINLVNHLVRKTDVLKEFDVWYTDIYH